MIVKIIRLIKTLLLATIIIKKHYDNHHDNQDNHDNHDNQDNQDN